MNVLERIAQWYWKPAGVGASTDDRVQIALNVKKNSVNDFFGGWEENDLNLLSSYQINNPIIPNSGEIVDWLGIRTAAKLHAWLPMPPCGSVNFQELPVPDDRVHAETIEYVSLLLSLERALHSGGKCFTAMELGASYAPWAIAAGVIAKRKGFKELNLIAVEANKETVTDITEHAFRNGLSNSFENVNVLAVHGAIYTNDEYVFFPKVNVANDNGAQITQYVLKKDYRGLDLDYEKIPGYSLNTLSTNYSQIDFLHMDVQGAEAMLLKDDAFIGILNQKVATFFIATQSRLIEGIALEKLSALGWSLIRERPTMYRQNNRTKDVNGWTLRDGGQLWINPKFGNYLSDF